MPRNPKLFIHNYVYMLGFSIQRGLPLAANRLIKQIILSHIARAAELHTQTVGDFLVMSNHIHMFILCHNPDEVDDFVGRIKTEISHAVNRLRGIPRGSVWLSGYDSPPILDLNKLIEKVIYVYSNPLEANLVDSIDQYPNLSSWKTLNNQGVAKIKCPRIARSSIPTITPDTEKEPTWDKKILRSILSKRKSFNYLEVNPRAMFEALKHTYDDDITFEEYRSKIVDGVAENERDYQEKRRSERKTVLGPKVLRHESIFTDYIPNPKGQKMICLASEAEVRKRYISFFRELKEQARKAYEYFKSSSLLTRYPPGMFAPGGATFGSLLPAALDFFSD